MFARAPPSRLRRHVPRLHVPHPPRVAAVSRPPPSQHPPLPGGASLPPPRPSPARAQLVAGPLHSVVHAPGSLPSISRRASNTTLPLVAVAAANGGASNARTSKSTAASHSAVVDVVVAVCVAFPDAASNTNVGTPSTLTAAPFTTSRHTSRLYPPLATSTDRIASRQGRRSPAGPEPGKTPRAATGTETGGDAREDARAETSRGESSATNHASNATVGSRHRACARVSRVAAYPPRMIPAATNPCSTGAGFDRFVSAMCDATEPPPESTTRRVVVFAGRSTASITSRDVARARHGTAMTQYTVAGVNVCAATSRCGPPSHTGSSRG